MKLLVALGLENYKTPLSPTCSYIVFVRQTFAWHPWKHSLMCYAVTSVDQHPVLGSVPAQSWIVLADGCKGQVLKRVDRTGLHSCPTVKILSVHTRSLTFSRLTGELLASVSTVYRVRK